MLDRILPKNVYDLIMPFYHAGLAYLGSLIYGFPSKHLKVIGITGTKGKSSVVYLLGKILEEAENKKIATLGSMGLRIGNKEWPNLIKMTMPGRFLIHKYMAQAKKAGCEYFIMEVTSEGIKLNRHLGIEFDCAVFTNLHEEHIESHGSFENYYRAKQELFKICKNIHVLNGDDPHIGLFWDYISKKKITYGIKRGDIRAEHLDLTSFGASFEVYGTKFKSNLLGKFNVSNCLGALATAAMYGVDLPSASPVIEKIKLIPGRMQIIQDKPSMIIVDYAHTPDSLREVYSYLKDEATRSGGRLVVVLGAAGGGRDKWKESEFGKIAEEYADVIYLTNEDPYDENPMEIILDIKKGITNQDNVQMILDRKQAIGEAIKSLKAGDVFVITGKGSETSIATGGGKKVPWSDVETVKSFL